jgi:hypothetical protein
MVLPALYILQPSSFHYFFLPLSSTTASQCHGLSIVIFLSNRSLSILVALSNCGLNIYTAVVPLNVLLLILMVIKSGE